MTERPKLHIMYDGGAITGCIIGTSARIHRIERTLKDALNGQTLMWVVEVYDAGKQLGESITLTDSGLVQYLQEGMPDNILVFLRDFPHVVGVLLRPVVPVQFTPSVTEHLSASALDDFLLNIMLGHIPQCVEATPETG